MATVLITGPDTDTAWDYLAGLVNTTPKPILPSNWASTSARCAAGKLGKALSSPTLFLPCNAVAI